MAKAKSSTATKAAPAPAPAAAAPAPAPAPVAAKPVAKPAVKPAKAVSEAERNRMIQEAAYYIAEKRGFAHGNHEQDWAEATAQIDRLLAK